jgi:hypothetical protein
MSVAVVRRDFLLSSSKPLYISKRAFIGEDIPVAVEVD